MPRYRVRLSGVAEVRKNIGVAAAEKLRDRVDDDIEQGVDSMAERAYEYSPKDTTALANSILASVHEEAPLTYVFGSHMAYAQRQEYEHKTKRGYFRRAIWREMVPLKHKLEYTIRRTLS